MADWMNKLDLSDIWSSVEDTDPENIDYVEQGRAIALQIRAATFSEIPKPDLDKLEKVAKLFDVVTDQDIFDTACDKLWDWGDGDMPTVKGRLQKRRCWIKTTI